MSWFAGAGAALFAALEGEREASQPERHDRGLLHPSSLSRRMAKVSLEPETKFDSDLNCKNLQSHYEIFLNLQNHSH